MPSSAVECSRVGAALVAARHGGTPCATLLLCLLMFAGCREKAQEDTPNVLATVGGRAITQSDFDAEAARRPGMAAEAVFSNLIERQAMLIKAESSGIAASAAFRRETENRLISEWLASVYQKERDAVTVSEDELQAAYTARKEKLFTSPPLTRFAILYRKGRNTDELKAALAEAAALFAADRAAATNSGRLPGFGKIAAEHSEDTISRYRGGDIGWVGKGAVSRVPAEILDAGAALAADEVSAPLAAGDGVYVIMKTAERDAASIDFKEAAPALRQRLLAEKRIAVEARFKEGLMKDVAVTRKAAPVVAAPAKKADAPPALPMPGGVSVEPSTPTND